MNQDEKIINKLQKTGLNDKAAKIYAFLLSTGGGYPSKIALETKINRSTVYKILLDLSVKGLVTEVIKRKKIYYQAEKPQKLLRYSNSALAMAQDAQEATKRLIPELDGLFASDKGKSKVRFFEGADEIKSIYEDHISTKEKYEMLGLVNASKVTNFLPEKFLRQYVKAKEKLGITSRGIVPDTEKDKNYSSDIYRNVKKTIWPQFRHIKKDIFPYDVELTIYGDKYISMIKLESERPVGIIIEDKVLHDTMKVFFELAWVGAER